MIYAGELNYIPRDNFRFRWWQLASDKWQLAAGGWL